MQSFELTSAFAECQRDCRREKLNHYITSALFCWRDFNRPLQKFKTIKIKPEKNPYTQANTCLLHVSRNFKDIFKFMYILYSLFLVNCKQLRKCNCLYRSLLSAMFFQQILDPISLESIWSYNFLACIPRHYCSVLHRYSVLKMQVSVNVFYISSQKIFSRIKTKRVIWPLF